MIEIINTVICYNNADEVIQYVNKVRQLEMSDKVVVVIVVNKLDNCSIETLQERLNNIDQKTFLVNPEENLGYMNGMLRGYQEYLERYSEHPKYVIMSNTDINYPDNKFLVNLLRAQYPDDVWCIGPAVYARERNNYDNPICEIRRTKEEVQKIIKIFRTPIINEIYFRLSNLKGMLVKKKRGNSRNVYEVHGCYFIVVDELAKAMALKPFGALLYSEEAYVAENTWHNGKVAYYDADLIVEHIEHTVTGKFEYKKLSKYIADSMEVVLRDFY